MTLFDRVFGGNDAVYGLTEGAIDGAIAQYGEDKAVSFPNTAYSLPCYYAVTGTKVTSLKELKEVFVPASENNDYSRIKYAKPDLSPVAPILSSGEMVTYNWTVEPGTRFCSGKFKVSSGQKIALSASIAPGTQTCWIGIMDPHNNVRYVEGKSALSHTFSISETGKYRVFVQNRGTKNVTAGGGYYFQ